MVRPKLQPRPLTLRDRYDVAMTKISRLQIDADQCRSQKQHEQLVARTEEVAEYLRAAVRGPR